MKIYVGSFSPFDNKELTTIDSIYAMNGKSVKVDTLMRKAAWYFRVWFLSLIFCEQVINFRDTATEYKPHTLIDVATLTE